MKLVMIENRQKQLKFQQINHSLHAVINKLHILTHLFTTATTTTTTTTTYIYLFIFKKYHK